MIRIYFLLILLIGISFLRAYAQEGSSWGDEPTLEPEKANVVIPQSDSVKTDTPVIKKEKRKNKKFTFLENTDTDAIEEPLEKVNKPRNANIGQYLFKPKQFGLIGAPSMEKSDLKGTGFQSQQSFSLGYSYGVSFKFWSENFDKNFYAQFIRSEYTFEDQAGLTPNSSKLQRDETKLGMTIMPWRNDIGSAFENIGFRYGYTFLNQDATATRPNQSISAYRSHGLHTGMVYEKFWDEKSILNSSAELYLPLYYQETITFTGNRSKTYSLKLDAGYAYVLHQSVAIRASVTYRFDYADFIGTGNRGTTDAVVTQHNFSIPIELIIMF